MWCCVAVGVLMSALFLIFMDQILTMIGASAETWDYAKTYLTIVSCQFAFFLKNTLKIRKFMIAPITGVVMPKASV